MDIADLVLRYLQLLLSWPVIALALGLTGMKLFKDLFSDFLRRVVKGEAYGVRLEASTPSEQRKEVQEAKAVPALESGDPTLEYITQNPEAIRNEYLRLLNGYWFEKPTTSSMAPSFSY